MAETGEAFGSRKDTAWEEDEEERKGSKEPLLELVAVEGGRTSGLLDEGLDQEEHGVAEREESKGEEEDDDDQQQEVLFDYL